MKCIYAGEFFFFFFNFVKIPNIGKHKINLSQYLKIIKIYKFKKNCAGETFCGIRIFIKCSLNRIFFPCMCCLFI